MKIKSALAMFAGMMSVAPVMEAQGTGFSVSSPAVTGGSETGFDSGLKSAGRIDSMYAAKDKGPANPRSLPFAWKNLPAGTKALALVLDDPDAKPVMASFGMKGDAFIHWIAADIDPALGGLAANASKNGASFEQGKNSGGEIGYTGPQPPSDVPKNAKKPLIHVYRLKLYALSARIDLHNGFTLNDLEAAMKGKILGRAELDFSFSNN
jgi:Raf kinase inhibitor-like YbhB/YbcL family protein